MRILATKSATYGPSNADGKIIGENGPRWPFAPTATLSRGHKASFSGKE
jgi:hypothetical protein